MGYYLDELRDAYIRYLWTADPANLLTPEEWAEENYTQCADCGRYWDDASIIDETCPDCAAEMEANSMWLGWDTAAL